MLISVFRLSAIVLSFLAQGYLFVRIRQVIGASRRSARLKSRAILLAGVAIGLVLILNGYVLLRYFPWVDPPVAAQVGLIYPVAVWNFGSLFSALVLFFTQLVGRLGRQAISLYRSPVSQVPSAPVNPGRRRFLQAGVGSLAAAPMVLSGYGAAYAAKSYDVEELTLPFGRSLRVVQLTDIHAGIYMTREEMRRYAEQVIALQPDLFVLTGDFISNSTAFLPGCLD
jgi:hypothetical protein